MADSSTKRLLGENRMEQLNRIQQDEDVEIQNRDTGRSSPPNLRYHDMQAAPKRLPPNISFAGIVRNKSAPFTLKPKTVQPTEIYHEKIKLECYKSEYEVFKNYLLDAKSLSKIDSKDCSGLLTVREFSKSLSSYNERSKFP